MLKYVLHLPKWLLICLTLAIAFSFPLNQEAIFVGISPAEVSGEIDLIQVGKWTALCSSPLLANGVILERSSRIELFTRLRVKKWRLRLREVGACVTCVVVWAVCVFGVSVWRIGSLKGLEFLLLYLSNLLLWSAVGLISYSWSKRAAWSSCIPIVLISGSCLIGLHFPRWLPYIPSTWGMLSLAICCGSYGGLPFMSVASLLSATMCYLIYIIYEENQNGNDRN